MSDELKGYIKVTEAARKLGRSTEQVRRYLREGKLEGRRIGGQWFIKETAVAYRTDPQQTTLPEEYRYLLEPPSEETLRRRREAMARIDQHREEIRQRWEREGIEPPDVVEELRRMREEQDEKWG